MISRIFVFTYAPKRFRYFVRDLNWLLPFVTWSISDWLLCTVGYQERTFEKPDCFLILNSAILQFESETVVTVANQSQKTKLEKRTTQETAH
ncbi:hypothetical protein BaRGS_00024466 [Batillaria attramentaria]|uniref:Uncharacterized protein n=1 Tax=Batillaria attramentaria TaxID=370345 RepID=A0ABD0KBH6_9CAEN